MRVDSIGTIQALHGAEKPSPVRKSSQTKEVAGTATDRRATEDSEVEPGSVNVSPETLKMNRETDDKKNTVYRLVDSRTGEVVSQVPSQQVLNVEDSIEQLLQQEIQRPKLDVKS